MSITRFRLEIQPVIPAALERLPELANDLAYSWDRRIRSLFSNLDRALWHDCGYNPKVFLRRISQERLDAAARDLVYMQDYEGVLSHYETYLAKRADARLQTLLDPEQDLVAYFCAEYGIHESLPTYSGGLGILAGDHCKAASDLGLPFVAVGLLYRSGYFEQTLDLHGNQILTHHDIDFDDLPMEIARDPQGREVVVQVDIRGRAVRLRVWMVRLGHIRLYLLDTDIESNSAEDRRITYQLYGGDIRTRIEQEICLGIGGVRALRALGHAPTVWHVNEGHAAFIVLERARELIQQGLAFDAALERVAAATVFTTHTPVAAGHDVFPQALILEYFGEYMKSLGASEAEFFALGASPVNQGSFNQTALALRGSRHHNGVSLIHGGVASRTESYIWPQVPPAENPLDHVTNGVHVLTFLAAPWVQMFDLRLGTQWRNQLSDETFWTRLDDIPDATFWSVRQLLKHDLLKEMRDRLTRQLLRNDSSHTEVKRLTRYLTGEQDICLLGFARRFATYKRATLLLSDPERLARVLNDPDRPALLLFAGKAHPRDVPGQDLIRAVTELSRRPEFAGRVLMLEGYDIGFARRLVTGVDVWLNTPEYPLEASGTSGMKAGINGVLNLSILDGWWGEGCREDNGWGITPHNPDTPIEERNHLEAHDFLSTLENEVLPLYYERNRQGCPVGWVRRAKASMKTILPHYNSQRMVMDYVRKFYGPASLHQAELAEDGCKLAVELARWKRHVRTEWPGVSVRVSESPSSRLHAGESLTLGVAAKLNGLSPDDVVVELLMGTEDAHGEFHVHESHRLDPVGQSAQGEQHFSLTLRPDLSGLVSYVVRMYPYHDLLAHKYEMGLMVSV